MGAALVHGDCRRRWPIPVSQRPEAGGGGDEEIAHAGCAPLRLVRKVGVSPREALHYGRLERNGGGGAGRRLRRPSAGRGAVWHHTRAQGGALGAGNDVLIRGSELQQWNSIRLQAWLTDGSSSMTTQGMARRRRLPAAPSNQETP
jgi:hypothetical protein